MNKNITLALGLIALIVVIILAVPYCAMLLWNWLMPELFGLKTVSFWQMVGLIVLMNILFKPTVTWKK